MYNRNSFDLTPGGALVPYGIRKDRILSAMLLDRSDSMGAFGDTTRKITNQFLDDLRRDVRHYHLTTVIGFSDELKVLIPPTPVMRVQALQEYLTDGGTLLYQTVDEVLQQILRSWYDMSMVDRAKTQVVVGVFSDGEDNRSDRMLYPNKVQATSRRCLEQGWLLTTFGIGVSGKELATNLGFPLDRAEDHAATNQGLRDAATSLGATTITGGMKLR